MRHGHKTAFLLALLACLTLLVAPRALASAANQIDKALAASKAWVTQIDAGKYDDSYTFACDETRKKYPEDQWISVLKTLRGPWGSVVDRHQLSHVYQPNGVKGLEGECVVITYNTHFKNLDNVTETVVLKWEDGQWRGAGYFAGVPPDENAPPPDNDSNTQVQTREHVKPTPNSP
jgi:hypothetical protein